MIALLDSEIEQGRRIAEFKSGREQEKMEIARRISQSVISEAESEEFKRKWNEKNKQE